MVFCYFVASFLPPFSTFFFLPLFHTRRCGVLMGQGLDYDQVTEALAGITLESLVITRIMGQAIRRKAELGLVDLKDFPLLMHIVDILDKGKADADMPWEAFTYEALSPAND